ncbi:MAG: 1-(5-phosphoribosyl)-5-amino-4-imidazole-carboxylate carboxylase, partial [Planctomycetota bacterium]
MQTDKLQELLQQFKFGHISLEETLSQLKQLPFQDLTIAKIDRHRALRCGFPEVIYAEHKTM